MAIATPCVKATPYVKIWTPIGGSIDEMVQQLSNDGRANMPEGDQPVEVLDLDILLVVAQRLLHAAMVKVRIEAHVRNAAAADALPLAAQRL